MGSAYQNTQLYSPIIVAKLETNYANTLYTKFKHENITV